jgi:uncharacterized integral membrane protein
MRPEWLPMAASKDTEDQAGRSIDRLRGPLGVALLVAGVLLGWFALVNFHDVSIDFWVRHTRAPLIVVILISGLLGALIATLAHRRRAPRK